MTDLLLAGAIAVEAVLIGAGTWLGYKVAFLADHPPPGWALLDAAFAIAFVRSVLELTAVLFQTSSYGFENDVDSVLTFSVVVLIFAGVSYMYRDFTRQLRHRQAEILAPRDR